MTSSTGYDIHIHVHPDPLALIALPYPQNETQAGLLDYALLIPTSWIAHFFTMCTVKQEIER